MKRETEKILRVKLVENAFIPDKVKTLLLYCINLRDILLFCTDPLGRYVDLASVIAEGNKPRLLSTSRGSVQDCYNISCCFRRKNILGINK